MGIARIKVDDNKESKWVAEDGSLKSLSLLNVKDLYKRLSKKGEELGKNKYWNNITDKEWKARWEYFAIKNTWTNGQTTEIQNPSSKALVWYKSWFKTNTKPKVSSLW